MSNPIKFLVRQNNGQLRGDIILSTEETERYKAASVIEKGIMRANLTDKANKQFKTACYLSEVLTPEPIDKAKIKESKKKLRQKLQTEQKDNYFIQWVSKELGIELTPEHRFFPARKWRFDYACIKHRIALEVEGGVFTQGRHSRGAGMVKDMEKYNRAAIEGWRLLRVTPSQLVTSKTLSLIDEAVKAVLLAQNSNNSL